MFLTSVEIMQGIGDEESGDVKMERIHKGWESAEKCSRGWTREAGEGGEAATEKWLWEWSILCRKKPMSEFSLHPRQLLPERSIFDRLPDSSISSSLGQFLTHGRCLDWGLKATNGSVRTRKNI